MLRFRPFLAFRDVNTPIPSIGITSNPCCLRVLHPGRVVQWYAPMRLVRNGAPFNLGLHRYRGGVYSPNGHKYIREFDCEGVPRMTYRVGGVILTKEKIFISNENRILIRYTLPRSRRPRI